MSKQNQAHRFFNEDCISGCKKYIDDDSVDLIITDPPYGIQGDKLHKHYNRKEEYVIDGYVEVPQDRYAAFSESWIQQAERILRPGGTLYIVSGYTNLVDILNALKKTCLKELNHIIWKYNFGVYTKRKYISSHYHILYYVKPGERHVFNTHCRYGPKESAENNGSLNYADREDVWIINREYKPGQRKNKNELPVKLLTKLIQYSSNEGDMVGDLFLGSFSTAKVAIGLNREAVGFELSKDAFDYQSEQIARVQCGQLLPELREPQGGSNVNEGKSWTADEKTALQERFTELYRQGKTKKRAIDMLSEEFGRGYWSINKLIGNVGQSSETQQLELFPE